MPNRIDPSAPLSFLIGPTAAGKSELAPLVAERCGAEILSMDSMLVYRGMDIGTAKPPPALLARAPHHLIDLVEPWERFTAQRYVELAAAAHAEVTSRGKRALFVGGTGLYLKLLTHGLFDGTPADPARRAELDRRWSEEGAEALHAELGRIDPSSAARIHKNDRKRVVRALEVWEATGRALSAWQQEWRGTSAASDGRARRIVGLDVGADELDRRIPLRTRELIDRGWADEVRRIRGARGFSATSRQALGYAEILRWIDGEIGREECERSIDLRTRQFARRQRTWFRQFPETRWIRPPAGAPGASSAHESAAHQQRDLAEVADEVSKALGWSS